MEKAEWINEFEKEFNVSFFGFNVNPNIVYFENNQNVFWVIKIDMNEKSISVSKPNRKYTNLKLTENDGLKVVEELMKHTYHWNDLGLDYPFHPLDETSVKRQPGEIDRWIFSFEKKVSKNAFGRIDWSEF